MQPGLHTDLDLAQQHDQAAVPAAPAAPAAPADSPANEGWQAAVGSKMALFAWEKRCWNEDVKKMLKLWFHVETLEVPKIEISENMIEYESSKMT